MIHSMCGGGLKNNEILSFAKVKFFPENAPEGLDVSRTYWFISEIPLLRAGDKVLAPLSGGGSCEAIVLRVDLSDEQTPPMPLRAMKKLISRA